MYKYKYKYKYSSFITLYTYIAWMTYIIIINIFIGIFEITRNTVKTYNMFVVPHRIIFATSFVLLVGT